MGWCEAFQKNRGSDIIVGIKQSRGDDTPFYTMGLVVVENGWESDDKGSFMPIYSTDGLAFAAQHYEQY